MRRYVEVSDSEEREAGGDQRGSGAKGGGAGWDGRALHSSTSHLNLRRVSSLKPPD